MIAFLIVLMTITPYMLGRLVLVPVRKSYADNPLLWYVLGFVVMTAVFQVVSMPFLFLKLPFSWLVVTYSVIIIVFTIMGFLNPKGKKIRESIRTIDFSLFWLVAFVLIIIQMLTSVCFTPAYVLSGDDTTYITMANDTVETNRIFLTDYMLGKPCTLIEVSPKYTLTSFVLFTAYLSKLSGLHTLIVCKTILPIFMIGLTYMVFGLMGSVVFKKDMEKTAIFLILVSLLNIFGAFTHYNLTFRLLACSWQGKAYMATICLPFLLYYILQIMEEECSKWEIFILFVAEIAAVSGSLFGAGLGAGMTMLLMLIYSIKKRKVYPLGYGVVCCIPGACCMGLYILYVIIITAMG